MHFFNICWYGDVANDLLGAYVKGSKALGCFIEERLEPSSSKYYHAPIPRLQLKTMALPKVKKATQEVVMKATRDLFGRLLVIGQTRQISLQELLKYCLGPLPLSIATLEGNPVKTVKANLLTVLEKKAEPATSIPPRSTWVIDAMAVLQSLTVGSIVTYNELASQIFDIITHGVSPDGRVDWVVDTYPEVSIKGVERERRSCATDGTLQTKIRSGKQKVDCQYKKALRSGPFKKELSLFLIKKWPEPEYAKRLQKRTMYVTAAEKCYLLETNDDSTEVHQRTAHDLQCSHEEADSRMLLHAAHASRCGAPVQPSSSNHQTQMWQW